MNNLKILIFILFCTVSSFTLAQEIKKTGFQQFKIGEIEAYVLSDGRIYTEPIQPSVAPLISAELLSQANVENDISDKFVDMSLNILLLKKGDHLILFDTGDGFSKLPDSGLLLDNLEIIGIKPEQITDIVITHAHPDHIGGLVDINGKSVFSKATIYMSRVEYDMINSGSVDYSKSIMQDEDMAHSIYQYLNGIISVVKPQLQLLEDGDTILDCITVELASGHTKGHFISTITSEGESITHIADIAHAEILLIHPEWGCAFDQNFNQAIDTRKAVLKKKSNDNSFIFSYHLPYPGVGRVKEISQDSYRWLPYSFASNRIGSLDY